MKLFAFLFKALAAISLVAILYGAEHHVLTLLICSIMYWACRSETNEDKEMRYRFHNPNAGLSTMDPAYNDEFDYDEACERYCDSCEERAEYNREYE